MFKFVSLIIHSVQVLVISKNLELFLFYYIFQTMSWRLSVNGKHTRGRMFDSPSGSPGNRSMRTSAFESGTISRNGTRWSWTVWATKNGCWESTIKWRNETWSVFNKPFQFVSFKTILKFIDLVTKVFLLCLLFSIFSKFFQHFFLDFIFVSLDHYANV